MKDLRVFLPVLLLIIIVLLLTGCGGFVPSPGTTEEDVTTIAGQIKMPLICCDTLSGKTDSLSRETGCDETELWPVTPGAIVELKSAEKGKCNKVLDTTITDETGNYVFEDVKPGLYIITAYCPVEDDKGFLTKDVAEKLSGQALDAGIPDCTSTALALVIEKINDCYNDWYQCFNKYSAIYRTVEDIASDIVTVDIPAIMGHENFGNYCDDNIYGLVDMICEWSCCQSPGATGGGGGNGDPTPRYSLTMAVNPEGSGTATDETGTSPYKSGTTVNISAAAKEGWKFVNWTSVADAEKAPLTKASRLISKAVVGSFAEEGNPDSTFTMPAQNVTVIANFEAIQPPDYTVTLSVDPEGAGTTSGGGTYNEDDSVDIGATANAGYTFINWTDDDDSDVVVSTDVSYNFTMPAADVNYTAHFSCPAFADPGLVIDMEKQEQVRSTIPMPLELCMDECAIINSVTIKYQCSELNEVIEDLTDDRLEWTYDDAKISFDLETGQVCLIGGYETGSAGKYTISATYTDPCGGEVSGSVEVEFIDCRCTELIANAGEDQCIQIACASEVVVDFDGSGSSGTNLTYEWDFGDGSSEYDAGATPSHTYTAAGTYEVELTVTDSCNNSYSDTLEVTIHSACGNLPAQLTVSSSETSFSRYLKVYFSDAGGDILEGNKYYGWCADETKEGFPINGDTLYAYCTLELDTYWPNINWIVNNRSDYNRMEVQYAIWYFIHHNGEGVKDYTNGLPYNLMEYHKSDIEALINAAMSHTTFCPAVGEQYVVLLTFNLIDSYGSLYKCPPSHEQNIMIEVTRINHCTSF